MQRGQNPPWQAILFPNLNESDSEDTSTPSVSDESEDVFNNGSDNGFDRFDDDDNNNDGDTHIDDNQNEEEEEEDEDEEMFDSTLEESDDDAFEPRVPIGHLMMGRHQVGAAPQ